LVDSKAGNSRRRQHVPDGWTWVSCRGAPRQTDKEVTLLKRNRLIKLIALFLVLALVLSGIATTIAVVLSGSQSVLGTYKSTNGNILTLEKNGVASLTVTVNKQTQSLAAAYKVKSGTVTVYDPSQTSQSINFTIDNGNLVTQDGTTWTKQE